MAEGEKHYGIKGEAEISGDAQGKVEFEAKATIESPGDAAAVALAEFETAKAAADEKWAAYEQASKGASRPTAKATADVPRRSFARSGAVD